MSRHLFALVFAALLAACVDTPRSPEAYSFGVMGDTPYSEGETREYLAMMREMDAEPLAFVIHVGDFKGGGACSDELFATRKREFEASAHPFIYTPGDNEWTDCRRPYMGSMDPLERLARLREVFFADDQSLGREKMPTRVQDRCADAACRCPVYRENRAWMRGGVRFVTLDIPGSDNNVGFDAASDAEAKCRDQANAAWLDAAVDASLAADTRALVVAIQADPWDNRRHAYDWLLAKLPESAARLRKPLLFVHGDTHALRMDQPFTRDGHAVANLTRLETYGSPFVGWIKVTVDPADPHLFGFEPKLKAFVLPSR
ncbi:MAG TPA: hypothetical protein VFE23_09165 [Usitatibacter sp.]|jgi:hypothetical protein|nr:hypothetical protein [Usitatibacter sp.]